MDVIWGSLWCSLLSANNFIKTPASLAKSHSKYMRNCVNGTHMVICENSHYPAIKIRIASLLLEIENIINRSNFVMIVYSEYNFSFVFAMSDICHRATLRRFILNEREKHCTRERRQKVHSAYRYMPKYWTQLEMLITNKVNIGMVVRAKCCS